MTKSIKEFAIDEIAESGQCFRITRCADGAWQVTACGKVLRLRELDGGEYELSCSEAEFDSVWRDYFDLDTDYAVYRSAVLPGDEYLKKAIEYGKGIRMLRQEPWEMLISFIISQRKSVPAIRTSVERLSERFGSLISEDTDKVQTETRDAEGNWYSGGNKAGCLSSAEKRTLSGDNCRRVYAFPTPAALAAADTAELAACGLGYRVDYVREAARLVDCGELDLEELAKLPTAELIEALMALKGVGIKVASCVALFGYHRLDTLPMDVWMKRVIETVYNGALPDEYKQYAGVLQQYMFNYARLNKVGVKA